MQSLKDVSTPHPQHTYILRKEDRQPHRSKIWNTRRINQVGTKFLKSDKINFSKQFRSQTLVLDYHFWQPSLYVLEKPLNRQTYGKLTD